MMGFGAITLPAAYMMASLSGACPAAATPSVHVALNASDPPYYTNMTSRDLTKGYADNPDSTLSTDGQWMIGGLTLSDIAGSYSVSFRTETDNTTHLTCFSVDEVDVDIVYTPQIFIASDFLSPEKKCRYTVTLAHERRHVGLDLETINDYTPQLQQQIADYIGTLGPQGPFDAAHIDGAEQSVTDAINAAAQPVVDQLIELRRQRQASIDTVENYNRETALCPGEFPDFNGDQ